MTTARDLITDALYDSGAYGQGDSLDPMDAQRSVRAMQRMLDSWSNDNLAIYTTTDATVPCVAGTASYATATWTPTTRPVTIQNAYLRSGTLDYKLSLIAELEYDELPDKTTQGLPCKLFYKADAATGTAYLYPTPDAAYTLHVVGRLPLASALTLDTVLTLPPGYERAIVKNLAVELCDTFGIDARGSLAQSAADSYRALVSTNFVPGKLKTGLPSYGKSYRIESGQ